MRNPRLGRFVLLSCVLAVGGVLGGALALAGQEDAPVIDLTVDDQVLDLQGELVVEGNQAFVAFKDARGNSQKVEVRGWNPTSKRSVAGHGSTVRVTGASAQGKRLEYRGHVTVLK
jgi:hypothetical protein